MKSVRYRHIFSLALVGLMVFSCGNEINFPDKNTLIKMAEKESMIPVRPGGPNQPFWNIHAKRFIHVPSFDFAVIDGADSYRFTAIASDSQKYQFTAKNPRSDLSPIWQQLPVGFVSLEVEALSGSKIIGPAGTRKFYRAAVFKSGYHKPVLPYKESAIGALKYLFDLDHYQNWLTTGKPDTSYDLYCYPTKIIGAVIKSMVLYSKYSPENAERALQIAEQAAHYLISVSEPAGAPLEYFPPTYVGTERTADQYKDQFMLIYPARVAVIYLDLYDRTQNKIYFEAAKHIADTYLKLQLPEGTWRLKLRSDGTAVNENYTMPMDMITLYEHLYKKYGITTYQASQERAFKWILENPVKTWNWEGQFEDVEPSQGYKNLSKHLACSFAIHLFEHMDQYPKYLDLAQEIVRFAEDQFVVWERPMPQEKWPTEQWITPCVLEQYHYYVPIDASAAKLIAVFQKAYEATGDILYLAKACELANTMTVAQDKETGRYPTYWEYNERLQKAGWINCATRDAQAMLDLADFLD